MLAQLKRLTTDTALYGLSNVLGRMINFLLVPLYTNVIAPGEYGYVGTVYAYIAFFTILFPYGMEIAFMRYFTAREQHDKKDVFSTPWLAVAATSLILAVIIHACSTDIASLIQLPERFSLIVVFAGWTLAVDAIAAIPYASLRMERRAFRFAVVRFSGILVAVLLNVWFIGIQHKSITWIFVAGFIGSCFALALLLPIILGRLRLKFSPSLFRTLLRFGLPTVPAGLAAMVVQVIDRPLLLAFSGEDVVGLYNANYKLGIFMMLLVGMFQYAWQPFFLQHAEDENAKRMFARVGTYFLAVAVGIWLLLSLFMNNIVQISVAGYYFIGSEYWTGLSIVPVILLAYIFTGMGTIFAAGLYIRKKTNWLPVISGTGAAVNVVTNLLLIPAMGMMGAALATLLSYVVMAMLSFLLGQRVYRVPYEYGRMLKLVFAAAVPACLWYLQIDPGLPEVVLKIVLVGLFPGLLFLLGFFERGERDIMIQLLKRISSTKE
ncbi:MAG: oligosaccharide flippase family protein [Chlorobi bacterium]|nr:oligosaccharide flippase family protein [Chlorobiota bacterium]